MFKKNLKIYFSEKSTDLEETASSLEEIDDWSTGEISSQKTKSSSGVQRRHSKRIADQKV